MELTLFHNVSLIHFVIHDYFITQLSHAAQFYVFSLLQMNSLSMRVSPQGVVENHWKCLGA